MKKILAIALALVMVLGLVACGNSGPAAEGKTKVSVFWYDEADVYLASVRDALNKELDAAGVEYDNQFAAGDQFKFRKGETWGTEVVYEGNVMPDAEYACAAGGGNSTIGAAGTYDVYLAQSLDKFYVMTPGKTPADAGEAVVTYIDASDINVGFSGSAIGWDDPSFDTNDRASFVSKEVTDEATFAGTYTYELAALTVAENDEFKIRINGDWIGATGATVEGLAVTGEDNFVAGEAGTYKVTITFAWDGLKPSDVKAVFAK